MRRRGPGAEIGRRAELRVAERPGAALAQLAREKWPKDMVIVVPGPALFKETVLPRLPRNEWGSAIALALEGEGWIGGEVRPAGKVSRISGREMAVQAVAWRDSGLSAWAQAAREAGFRPIGAYHVALALVAATKPLLGPKNTWLAYPDADGCDLVLASPGSVLLYRRLSSGGAGNAEPLAAEIIRSVSGDNPLAPIMVIGEGKFAGELAQVLNAAGLQARTGRAAVGMSAQASSQIGRLADLAGAGAAHMGLADARPDLLQALAGSAAGDRPSQRTARELVLALLCLAIGAGLLGLRAHNDLAAAADWVKRHTAEYEAVAARLEECAQVERKLASLSQIMQERRDYLEALLALELSLPAGTRVDFVAFEGDAMVELSGSTPQASQLMAALEDSGRFAGLQFKGPIRAIESKGLRLEEFHVGGRLIAGEGTDQ